MLWLKLFLKGNAVAMAKVLSVICPKVKEEALTVIREIENRKRRYSVGLMQITSSNFSFYSTSAEKLLDSCENLSVFEKIIVDCYKRGRSLENALSCYYTGNFSNGKRKEKEFNNTSYVERIGYTGNEKKYVVPGTRSNGENSEKIVHTMRQLSGPKPF
uniref:transglycosylase SLT domain-containing protein n=1 Tax=Escherichia coli TaxID=562 RepID=UPI00202CC5B1|nr:transglycosylase SLT domain-containing protein [Escherichia coli]